MKKKILWRLLSIFFQNVEFKTYTNQRSGILKNGGCIVYLRGKRIAYLYAIVDTCGDVVEVFKQGIFASFFMDEMEQHLMDHMMLEEEKTDKPRNLYFNCIDTPLK